MGKNKSNSEALLTPEEIQEFQQAVQKKTGRLLTPEQAEDQLLKYLSLEELYKQFQIDHKFLLENKKTKEQNGD